MCIYIYIHIIIYHYIIYMCIYVYIYIYYMMHTLNYNGSLDIIGSCSGYREFGHWRLLASLCLGGCARHWTIGRGLGRLGLSRARKTRSLMQRRMIMIYYDYLTSPEWPSMWRCATKITTECTWCTWCAHDAHGKCINVWSHLQRLQPSLICGARQIKQKQAQVESIEADLRKQILQETGRFELLSFWAVVFQAFQDHYSVNLQEQIERDGARVKIMTDHLVNVQQASCGVPFDFFGSRERKNEQQSIKYNAYLEYIR